MTDLEPIDSEEIPAGWYSDPTPHRRPRERLWTGEEWTSWTRPVQADRVEDDPAGWRIDPADPSLERLWTGSQWTDAHRSAENALVPDEEWDEVADVPAPIHPEWGSAGWYPDERRPGMQRYWDGEVWTEHEREVPTVPFAPVPVTAQPVAAPERAATAIDVPRPEADPGPDAGSDAAGPDAEPDAAGGDPLAKIAELARLHQAGALTDAEFEATKARLLRQV